MSRSPPPECVCTVMSYSTHADHTGSYRASLYAGYGAQVCGIMMPPLRPCSAAHLISLTDASGSCTIGTHATPARRSGLLAHRSASHRLCARAPAMTFSGSLDPELASPEPNGDESTLPTPRTSASG